MIRSAFFGFRSRSEVVCQAQISERAEVGESTKTTLSASLDQVTEASLPVLATPEMPWRGR
jgi:hypothetical protein